MALTLVHCSARNRMAVTVMPPMCSARNSVRVREHKPRKAGAPGKITPKRGSKTTGRRETTQTAGGRIGKPGEEENCPNRRLFNTLSIHLR